MANERKFVVENIRRVLLREYLMKETERAGFGGLDIQRTPIGTRISLFIERPGLVIGRQGGAIKRLTETLEREFKFDNPQIEVQEVDNPSLNAQIMAEKLAVALERGWHFRRAGHSTVRRIMDSGARGCQVVISGKLTGQRHRTEKFKEGHIKHCGEPSREFMRDGFAVAKLKLGIIGVKVQIMDSDTKLPDDIEVMKAPVVVEGEEPVAALEPSVEAETPVETAVAEVTVEAPAVEAKAEPEAPVKPALAPVVEAKVEPEKAAEPAKAPAEEPKVVAKPAIPEKPKSEEPVPVKKPLPLPAEEPKVEAKPAIPEKVKPKEPAPIEKPLPLPAEEPKVVAKPATPEKPKPEEPVPVKKPSPPPAEEPKVEAKPAVAETEKAKPEEPERLGKPTPLIEEKKEKEKVKKKERKVRDGKDLKTKKLKMVARKLEKLGEDVDVELREEEEESK